MWNGNALSSSNWLMMHDPNLTASGYQQGFSAPSSSSGPVFQSGGPPRSQSALGNRLIGTSESPASFAISQQSMPGTESPAYDESCSSVGEYYVDGEPARLPRVKRRKIATAPVAPDRKRVEIAGSWHPFSLRINDPTDDPKDHAWTISADAWAEINESYLTLCIDPRHAAWIAYEPVALPSRQAFGRLLYLYYQHFDQILPFWHRAFCHVAEQRPILTLTMAAIGSHYLQEAHQSPLTNSMHEFARRWLLFLHENIPEGRERSVHVAGAHLLHLVGMAYCGDESSRLRARDSRHELLEIFALCRRRTGLVLPLPPLAAQTRDEETEWREWVIEEGNKRLAYSAWFVDGMLAAHFSTPINLSLRDACLPLPCEEKLWYASTRQEWRALHDSQRTYPTLTEAMQELYVEKRVAKDRGEFARILTVHGLHHRMWDVERYYSDPLSHWEPTASRQSTTNLPKSPIWLPSIPAYTKWQNSACDALDVLHWQANATIGQNSGLEHPTVLHLHMARVFLLVPLDDITRLARSIASGKSPNSDASIATKNLVQRWAVQHQYKARLAVLHAGSSFWHVRRYAIDAFYEAPTIALCALVLWAFGTFGQHRSAAAQEGQTATAQNTGEDDAPCEIILIDRPTDDELVQQFIHSGDTMRVHMTGVDDLYGPGGPEAALAQGIKVLGDLRCWEANKYDALQPGHVTDDTFTAMLLERFDSA
ncbi:unnamed protein product [Zymoseptoria tritici ST99CH_3D1]|nr:unnamed protein product [Zymoseptoria tritici ST99CH_3D1]